MELRYTVRRSARRKKLTITVERDRSVVVHAPAAMPDEAIGQAVEAKRQWIREKTRHGRKYREPPHPPGKELVNGESALYLGRSYRIELVKGDAGDAGGVRLDRCFFVPAPPGPRGRSRTAEAPAGRGDARSRGGARADCGRSAMRDWYVARAKEHILPRVERHARSLGVRYGRARIVDNRYRWGSCTARGNVSFNWRLIKAPAFVIDYVVVHELAHLIEPNHTERFWGIVRSHAPGMEGARAWLREHGQLLEELV